MFLSEGTAEGDACGYTDETNRKRRPQQAVYELRGRRIAKDADRACESGLHRHPCDGGSRQFTETARLGLLRSRSGFRRICRCGARCVAHKRATGCAEAGIVSENLG